MDKITLALLAVTSGLYILGAYQGSTIADEIDNSLAPKEELGPMGRFIVTWLWPYATLRAMGENVYGK